MARFGDVGPYQIGNVEIKTHGANVGERNQTYAARVKRWSSRDETDDWRHVVAIGESHD